MDVPAAPPARIRPALAVLLAIFVGMFSTLFGLAALFERDAQMVPLVRLLMPCALLVAPVVVAIQVRRLGIWMSVTAWALASGAALVICAPIAMMMNGTAGTLALLGGIVVMMSVGRSIGREVEHPAVPPRIDEHRTFLPAPDR